MTPGTKRLSKPGSHDWFDSYRMFTRFSDWKETRSNEETLFCGEIDGSWNDDHEVRHTHACDAHAYCRNRQAKKYRKETFERYLNSYRSEHDLSKIRLEMLENSEKLVKTERFEMGYFFSYKKDRFSENAINRIISPIVDNKVSI